MSEYTPTTEEMRSEYTDYCTSDDCHQHQWVGRMFDEWLAAVQSAAYELAIVTLVSESDYEYARSTNPYDEVRK